MARNASRQPNDSRPPKVDRRGFLRRSAAAAAGLATAPYIIPGAAWGANGATPPSERLVMGCIGVGSMGTGNMKNFLGFKDLQVVAVCDVDGRHREQAQGIVNEAYGTEDCKGYNDFREMLARDDLDVVSLALPDHWHAIPAIAAADRGLDIYAEKPLALTIRQGRAMVDAIERYGTIWQTGSWQRSVGHFRRACELVRNGVLGDIHTVKVGLPTGSTIEPQPPMPVPDPLDYDFWLGPAPAEPYTEKRCHWDFRWILDYSGGQLTDWGAHHCDIANWGMGTERTGPRSAEGEGTFPRDGLWNAATHYYFTCEYPPGASPVAPRGFIMHVANNTQISQGARFEGEHGWIHVNRKGMTASSDKILKTELDDNAIRLYDSPNHARNFIDGVRTRQECVAPVQAAHYAINVAHIGNIAMQLRRKVYWDPEAERFVNDAQANRMLARAMRAPWRL